MEAWGRGVQSGDVERRSGGLERSVREGGRGWGGGGEGGGVQAWEVKGEGTIRRRGRVASTQSLP